MPFVGKLIQECLLRAGTDSVRQIARNRVRIVANLTPALFFETGHLFHPHSPLGVSSQIQPFGGFAGSFLIRLLTRCRSGALQGVLL